MVSGNGSESIDIARLKGVSGKTRSQFKGSENVFLTFVLKNEGSGECVSFLFYANFENYPSKPEWLGYLASLLKVEFCL